MASKMRSQLTIIFSQPVWEEGKRERETESRKEGKVLERESLPSLQIFPVIDSANFGDARSKVGLRCKGYTWVQVLWSFGNSER